MKKEKTLGGVLLVFLIFLVSTTFISAAELRVTEEHPFLVDGEWITASELEVGDELTTIDGEKVKITEIEDIEVPENESFLVYNLEAGKYSDFVADGDGAQGLEGVVVHNSGKASWTGSQLFKSVKGYKPGTPEYLTEEIPCWAYFDKASEMVPDVANPGTMISRLESIQTYGHYGSARTSVAAWIDKISGSGKIRNFWFTTIPRKNLHPSYLKQLIHGGTLDITDLGVIELTLPRGKALEAYGKTSLQDSFNLLKIQGYQFESSYISVFDKDIVLPPGTFTAYKVPLSELGVNVKSRMILVRSAIRGVKETGKLWFSTIFFGASSSILGYTLGQTLNPEPIPIVQISSNEESETPVNP